MNLPKRKTQKINSQGFSLIELLVVVSIMAVLAVVGYAVFSGVTGRGNDSRRQADIKAIGDALEVKRGVNDSYQSLVATDFAGGAVPAEPTTRVEKYCYREGTTAIANPTPADWTPATPVVCPTSYANVSGAAGITVTANMTFFKVCTINQAKTSVICVGSKQ